MPQKADGIKCTKHEAKINVQPYARAWAESTFIQTGILVHPAVWPQQTWAENWGLCSVRGRAESPSNAMWPGPRPYLHARFHLDPPDRLAAIHKRHRQTDRTGQTSQDRQARTDRTTVRQHKVNRFANGRPKIEHKVCRYRDESFRNRILKNFP